MMQIEFREEADGVVPTTALYVERSFLISYDQFDIPDEIKSQIKGMIEAAVQYGERKKQAEIRAVIGAR